MHPSLSPATTPMSLDPPLGVIHACRLCESRHLQPVVDFGVRHMVDFPDRADGMTKPPLPLEVVQCRSCTLVQLKHTAPSDWRYATYYYRSGTNEAMREELADVVRQIRDEHGITGRDTVLDLGANDGTLLRAYEAEHNTPLRIGVEPASNLQASLQQHCDLALNQTWPLPPAGAPRGRPLLPDATCAAVTSIAMMYGADDLNAFTAEVKRVLRPDGLWVIQFQDLLSVLQTNAIDWFVHEHLATFSLWSLAQLLHRHGLTIVDVESRRINGGSLRVYVRHKGVGQATPAVGAQLERERAAGLLKAGEGFAGFLARIELVKVALRSMVDEALSRGKVIDLYAASTKASLLLQLVGLDQRHIRQAVERQAQKVGRFVGASGIPIVSEETMRENPPDILVLGAWQFREVFLTREAAFLDNGGRMICPLPVPEWILSRS